MSAADKHAIDAAVLTLMHEHAVWSLIVQINLHSANGSVHIRLRPSSTTEQGGTLARVSSIVCYPSMAITTAAAWPA
jgi:hypothetical protein